MRFSSGERRATVLLLVLTGVIIAVVFIMRSDPELQSLPAVDPAEMEGRCDADSIVKKDSTGMKRREGRQQKKSSKAGKRKKKAERERSGRKRDFLDEPVGGR